MGFWQYSGIMSWAKGWYLFFHVTEQCNGDSAKFRGLFLNPSPPQPTESPSVLVRGFMILCHFTHPFLFAWSHIYGSGYLLWKMTSFKWWCCRMYKPFNWQLLSFSGQGVGIDVGNDQMSIKKTFMFPYAWEGAGGCIVAVTIFAIVCQNATWTLFPCWQFLGR